VLSRDALVAAIGERAEALGIGPDVPLAEYPPALNRALDSPGGAVPAAAVSVASIYGRRLGYLFASLNTRNALSEDAWERAYLEHWEHRVTGIALGGGLATGRLGQVIAASAQAAAHELGRAIAVEAAAHASVLPLLGAGRRLAADDPDDEALVDGTLGVADFGSSGVKSGVALIDGRGALSALYVRPVMGLGRLTDGAHAPALADAMVRVIGDVYRAAEANGTVRRTAPRVVCTVAAYVAAGQPVPQSRGAYTQLHQVAGTSDVAGWLARRAGQAVGARLRVSLLHDGTAAASAYAGEARPGSRAVVMLGTALGVGFVPAGAAHRRLAEDLHVAPLSQVAQV
jgi:hypothetical protein